MFVNFNQEAILDNKTLSVLEVMAYEFEARSSIRRATESSLGGIGQVCVLN